MADTWLHSHLSLQSSIFWLFLTLCCGVLLLVCSRRWRRQCAQAAQVRWLVIPYLALLSGAVSPRLMGFTGINWFASFVLGAGLAGIIFFILLLIRTTSQAARLATLGSERPLAWSGGNYTRYVISIWNAAAGRVVMSGAEEFHWAFLRGAIGEALLRAPILIEQSTYWAIWLATLAATPDLFLCQPTPLQRLFKGVALLLTAILFYYTRNFWLCWALHAGVSVLLNSPYAHSAD